MCRDKIISLLSVSSCSGIYLCNVLTVPDVEILFGLGLAVFIREGEVYAIPVAVCADSRNLKGSAVLCNSTYVSVRMVLCVRRRACKRSEEEASKLTRVGINVCNLKIFNLCVLENDFVGACCEEVSIDIEYLTVNLKSRPNVVELNTLVGFSEIHNTFACSRGIGSSS